MIKYDKTANTDGYKFTPLDYLKIELGTQINRIKYAWVMKTKGTTCNYFPRKVSLEPTSFCNLKCIHCPHGASPDSKERMTRTKSMMDMEVYKKIIDECAEHKYSTKVVFALLGEPTIHPELVEMVAYASRKKVWTQVNTNCTQLTKEYATRLINSGVNMIYLSLDGVNKETYEKIRLRSDYDVVIENILNFLELRMELKAYHLTVHIGMTGEIINQDEIDIFINEFRKLPVDALYSPLLFNWNGAIEWANPELKNLQKENVKNYPICNTSFDICAIYSNGDFLPCIYDYDAKYVSGNVKDDTIEHFWNNGRTKKFRQAVIDRDYDKIEEKGKLCSECSILWNPEYQVDPALSTNLGQIVKFVIKSFKDYFNTKKRIKSLEKKYEYLKENRETFLKDLSHKQKNSKEYYNKMKSEGVLRVETN